MTGKFFFILFVGMGIFPSDERNRIKKYIYTSKLLPLFPATKVRRFELGFLEHLQKRERGMKTEVEVRGGRLSKIPNLISLSFPFFSFPISFSHIRKIKKRKGLVFRLLLSLCGFSFFLFAGEEGVWGFRFEKMLLERTLGSLCRLKLSACYLFQFFVKSVFPGKKGGESTKTNISTNLICTN